MSRCTLATVVLALAIAAPAHADVTRGPDIDWCGGRGTSVHHLETTVRNAETFNDYSIVALAHVGCTKRISSDLRAVVLAAYARFENWSKLPHADLQAYLADLVQDSPVTERTCAALDLSRQGSRALAVLLDCHATDPDRGGRRFAPEDDPSSPFASLNAIYSCLTSAGNIELESRFALCGAEWRALDKADLARRIEKQPVPVRTRIRIVLRRVEEAIAAAEASLAPIVKADPVLKAFFYDVPDKAFKEVRALHLEGAETLAVVRELEAKLDASSRPQVKGCFVDLRARLMPLLKKSKPTTVEQVRKNMSGIIASRLARALAACATKDGQREYGDALWNALESVRDIRGPRANVYWALHDTLASMEGKPAIEQQEFERLKPDGQRVRPAAPIDDKRVYPKIKKVSKVSGGVMLVFETVVRKERVLDCRDTNKVKRIGADGTVHYEQVCGREHTETERTTEEPALVKIENAAELVPGRSIEMVCTRIDESSRTCAPMFVHHGKTVVAVLGAAL